MLTSPKAFGPGLFRVLLAALVVLSHLSNAEIGRPAVFVFFMLSGYWVLRMYDCKYSRETTIPVFYLSRFLRIWLAFSIAFLGVWLLTQTGLQPRPVSMLSGLAVFGIATTHQDVLGTSWSLDIELQFYLLIPLLSVLLGQKNPGQGRIALILALSAVTAVAGWILADRTGIMTVLCYIPSFVIGALLWKSQARVSGKIASASVLAFVLIGAAVYASPYFRPLFLKSVPGPFNEDWFGIAWTALLIPFVAWNVQQPSPPRDMHLGNYSYALYITHWPVIALAGPFLAPLSIADRVILLGVIGVVSAVFYWAVDRPLERLRQSLVRRMTGRRAQAVAVARD